jgi:hypothetical protein
MLLKLTQKTNSNFHDKKLASASFLFIKFIWQEVVEIPFFAYRLRIFKEPKMPISEEARIKKNLANLTPLSIEKLQQLQDIELKAFAKFQGQFDELETAFGFLRLGFQIGWKPLAIIHSKKTFRKYEQLLDINARELFQEETPASDRSKGYLIAKKLSNFWKVVSGDVKVENRREISSL